MKIILLIGAFILCSGGVYADTLKLVGEDTVQKDDAAAKTGDDIVQKKGIEVDKRHSVKDGDTLWDLSMKYYLNPFKWGIIYNANVDIIDNPDLIYPAEEIIIPGLKEKIEPEIIVVPGFKEEMIDYKVEKVVVKEVPVVKKPVELPKKIVKKIPEPKRFEVPVLSEEMPLDQTEWNTMLETELVEKNWSGDGSIIGKEDKLEENSLSLRGDIVKIQMKSSKSVSIGSVLKAYKIGAKVHDENGKFEGIKIQKVGLIEVIEVDENKVRGLVVDMNSPIMQGQIVKK